jgi:hypothetical protein
MMNHTMRTKIYHCFLALFLVGSLSTCSTEKPWEAPVGTFSGKVIVLGIDGLDRRLIERMTRQGALPHFARLMREGVVTDMRVGQPILSPRIWTSIASGYAPEVHGITDWVRPDGAPFRASDVRVERVWDAASNAGQNVLVSGWLMTTPVSKVQGVMLSDELVLRGSLDMEPSFSPRRDPSVKDGWLAWPETRLKEAKEWIPSRSWSKAHALGYQNEVYDNLLHPLRRDETHLRSLEVLGRTLQPTLSMIYLSGADQLSHQYWPYADPQGVAAMKADPTLRQRSAEQLAQMHKGNRRVPLSEDPTSAEDLTEGARWVPDYYRYLDTLVGRVFSMVDGSKTTLIICSDHGFRTGDRPVPLFSDHRDPAILMAWGRQVRRGGRPQREVQMLDVAPTLYALLGLPAAQDMPGRVLTGLFDTHAIPPIASRVRSVPGAKSGTPSDHPRRQQLEALGYIDKEGVPIPQPVE